MNSGNKNKTCLLIMPTNHNQDISLTLKVSTLIEIIKELEKEKIEIRIATYRGNKPYLNFENDEKNRKWVEKNEDILLNVSNLDNISPSKFDGVLVPNYLYIYDELKINDHSLCNLLTKFHLANKIICTIGHSTYSLCKCVESEENSWPFIGYNLTGYSLNNIMRENLFGVVPFIIEEMVLLQGANFISSSEASMSDDVLVISDRNIVTGMDDFSLHLCLHNFIKKL
jgi:putative intracellular protease/amidase